MKSTLIRILAFAYRNYIFAVRNFATFAEMLFWPTIGIFSVGLMAGFLKLDAQLNSFLLTGAIVAGVLQTSQLDVAFGFLYDVWSKSVKQTFIAPVKNIEYILGSWLVGTLLGVITFALLALLSVIVFKFKLPSIPVFLVSMTGVYMTAMISGMAVIFFILMFGQRIDIIAWMISTLMMLLCGIYYPVTYLPKFFADVAQFIPLTYFLEYFRTGYGFALNFTHPLLKGFGLSVLYIGVLLYLIEVACVKAKQSGMLVRLSE
ncbi:MAG: ABC transporter permease [Spirochaetia bacterium]|nr:ABC transporter permease [Spirochaetia bacterium]